MALSHSPPRSLATVEAAMRPTRCARTRTRPERPVVSPPTPARRPTYTGRYTNAELLALILRMAAAEPQEDPEPEAKEPEPELPKEPEPEPEPEPAPSSMSDVPQCPGAPLLRHHGFSSPLSGSESWGDALIQGHEAWDFLAMPEDNGTTRTPAADEDVSESMGDEPSSDSGRDGETTTPVSAAAMQDLEQDGVPCCVCGDRTWGAVDEVCPNCLPIAVRCLRRRV